MLSFATFTVLLALAHAYTDPECANYEHDEYGCCGQCMPTSSCPGGKYQSSLCPTQAADVKCCFTAETDAECAEYNHPTHGQVGQCIDKDQCPYDNYISNLCPNKAANVKCCFSKPTGTCTSGGGSGNRQDLACEILYHSNVYLLDNNGHLNSLGWNDLASAKDNIRDTCNGGMAKRSSYCCSSGCSPGGYTYLSTSVLQYILDLLDEGHYLQINCLAGACHSSNSWHYQGTAVDFQITSGCDYDRWMSVCDAHGCRENLGPGYPGHSTHTHCAFSS